MVLNGLPQTASPGVYVFMWKSHLCDRTELNLPLHRVFSLSIPEVSCPLKDISDLFSLFSLFSDDYLYETAPVYHEVKGESREAGE